jgi:hypothetical protein
VPHRIISSPDDLAEFTILLGNLDLPITVEWTKGKDRSLDQNATMWMWASEAGNQIGETADEVQRRWKLHHGVPILREDSAEFRRVYDKALKPIAYPMKLEAMRFIPVTSEMKVGQMVRLLDAIWCECSEMGIRLTDPDPELVAYQNRYGRRAA